MYYVIRVGTTRIREYLVLLITEIELIRKTRSLENLRKLSTYARHVRAFGYAAQYWSAVYPLMLYTDALPCAYSFQLQHIKSRFVRLLEAMGEYGWPTQQKLCAASRCAFSGRRLLRWHRPCTLRICPACIGRRVRGAYAGMASLLDAEKSAGVLVWNSRWRSLQPLPIAIDENAKLDLVDLEDTYARVNACRLQLVRGLRHAALGGYTRIEMFPWVRAVSGKFTAKWIPTVGIVAALPVDADVSELAFVQNFRIYKRPDAKLLAILVGKALQTHPYALDAEPWCYSQYLRWLGRRHAMEPFGALRDLEMIKLIGDSCGKSGKFQQQVSCDGVSSKSDV